MQRWRERCVKLLQRFILYFHLPGFNFEGGGGRRGDQGCIQWLLDQLVGEVQHHQQQQAYNLLQDQVVAHLGQFLVEAQAAGVAGVPGLVPPPPAPVPPAPPAPPSPPAQPAGLMDQGPRPRRRPWGAPARMRQLALLPLLSSSTRRLET